LIEVMKGHIFATAVMNRDKGTELSLDPVLRELGLRELLQDDEA
jgi:hypothetical protein